LLARFSTRILNPPRPPNATERAVLASLGHDLATRFSPTGDGPDSCTALLARLWRGYFGPNLPFARYSPQWSAMGFQHNKDPASDVRGGGALSLACLAYFVEQYPEVAQGMVARQRNRHATRGEFGSYPWACAGIAVMRKLCELVGVVEPRTGKPEPPEVLHAHAATFWHVVGSRVAFFELFCWAFATLDARWDAAGATYMQFPAVMSAVARHVSDVLHRLPPGVVPSARGVASHDFADEGARRSSNNVQDLEHSSRSRPSSNSGSKISSSSSDAKQPIHQPRWVLEGLHAHEAESDSSEDEAYYSEEEVADFSHRIATSATAVSSSGGGEDLLGLGLYADEGRFSLPQPAAALPFGSLEGRSSPQSDRKALRQIEVNFFKEFGLAD
jgi:hypothetical protein